MSGKNIKIEFLERKSNFPFKIDSIYYCWDYVRIVGFPQVMDDNMLEFSIRLSCAADKCMDEVDGVPCAVTFPHVLVKQPGSTIISTQSEPRDTIAFIYPSSAAEGLKQLGLLPDKLCWEFKMTPVIEQLIKDFRQCLYTVYAPGVADEIDWICFKLLRELLHHEQNQETDEKITMQNASVWMQVHYSEKFATEEIARQYNMSRATFYRVWKKYFDVSPIQYLLNLRLEAAANLLRETPISIMRIADEVGFCGVDAFYRKFKEKYNSTPAEYRKNNPPADK